MILDRSLRERRQEARAYALAANFEPEKVERMFEMFRDYNLARRTYALDSDAVWYNWVDREVGIVTEDAHRARARVYCAGTGPHSQRQIGRVT